MKTDSQKLDELIKVVSDMSLREDYIICELIEIKSYIRDELVTKKEFSGFRGEVLDQLDSHTHMLVRLDEERLVTHERLIRLEQKA